MKSTCVWVCRGCGGTRGHRLTTGSPGRAIELSDVIVIAVQYDRSLVAYTGECRCKEPA